MDVLFFFLMIRRPPRSTQSRSSAASDVYKRQAIGLAQVVQLKPVAGLHKNELPELTCSAEESPTHIVDGVATAVGAVLPEKCAITVSPVVKRKEIAVSFMPGTGVWWCISQWSKQ